MFYRLETERQSGAWNPYMYKTRASLFVRQLAGLDPNYAHGNQYQTSSGMHLYNCHDQVLQKTKAPLVTLGE
jgi:hypothetical protein